MSDTAPIVAGNPNPISGPIQSSWRKGQGRTLTYTAQGPADVIRGAAAGITGAQEVSVTQEHGSAVAKLSATYARNPEGDADPAEETLSIRFNDSPFPLNLHTLFVGISDERIAAINKIGEDTTQPIPTDPTEALYVKKWRRGERTFRVKVPVLTYTVNAAEDQGESVSITECGLIYTPDQVALRVASPVVFSIPYNTPGLTAGTGFIAGYLLDAQVEFLANGRVNLVETYEYGLWDSDLYAAAP